MDGDELCLVSFWLDRQPWALEHYPDHESTLMLAIDDKITPADVRKCMDKNGFKSNIQYNKVLNFGGYYRTGSDPDTGDTADDDGSQAAAAVSSAPSSIPSCLYPGQQLFATSGEHTLFSGSYAVPHIDSKIYGATVAHLFKQCNEGENEIDEVFYKESEPPIATSDKRRRYPSVRQTNGTEFFADLALLEMVTTITTKNEIRLNSTGEPCKLIVKRIPTGKSDVIVVLRDGQQVEGQAHSPFSSRNNNIFQAISVTKKNTTTPEKVTELGDSGGLVMGTQPCKDSYGNWVLPVYGIVTGLLDDSSRSCTVACRLMEVLQVLGGIDANFRDIVSLPPSETAAITTPIVPSNFESGYGTGPFS